MLPFQGLGWLDGAVGWFRFWLLPRALQIPLIWLVAWLVIGFLGRCWQAWLRPVLVAAPDRGSAQALWRRRQLLALPLGITRTVVWGMAMGLTAELLGVSREAFLGVVAAATLLTLWSGRHVLLDISAGYALLLDDVLAPGDRLSLPFGEGTVERVTPFHVHLRLNEEVTLVVPHRLLQQAPIKVWRPQKVRR